MSRRRRPEKREILPDPRFGDEVLLRLLLDEPEQVPAAFGRLFSGPVADPVLAFLDEDTDLVEEVRLLGRLPLAPFARAAAARRRPRRA
jgi:small subunit ribosomal protein S7